MKVLKFGGTSVGSAERIKHVAGLVAERGKNIVVLSAMAGTTNALVEIAVSIYEKNAGKAEEMIGTLEKKYFQTIDELYAESATKANARNGVEAHFERLRQLAGQPFSETEEKEVLAQGELLSTFMADLYLRENGIASVLLPALDYMRTDAYGEPDMPAIRKGLKELLGRHREADLYITQGYICRNDRGEVDNLQRGGSDYSATLIGAAVQAEEIEIWTDIDGLHNNDPRFVEKTRPVGKLNFEEAAELAYFGAKILHPLCIRPAEQNNVPVRLLNTMDPKAKGTLIGRESDKGGAKAVAAKDGIAVIGVRSARTEPAHRFLRNVFEALEDCRIIADLAAVSEGCVSVAVGSVKDAEAAVGRLRRLGEVSVEPDLVLVSVVGDMDWRNRGVCTKAADALAGLPVRLISYGGSCSNISFVVRKEDKVDALNLLSQRLFND